MKKQLSAAGLDDSIVGKQLAIISSMTRKERQKPALMNASRKKRVAAGSGADVQEVNKLLKMHRQMADVMKMMGGGKGRGLGQALGNMFGLGGGMPQPTPEMLEKLKQMGGGMPPGFQGAGSGGGLPPLPPGLSGGKAPPLPGLGGPKLPGGLPGLGGFPFGGKKK
jgi:signal recognition particle subunit SRP54